MKFNYNSYKQPLTFRFVVRADEPLRIRIIAKDEARPDTVYLDRFNNIPKDKEQTFFVKMPVSPEKTTFYIFNQKTGGDNGFQVVSKDILPLITKMHTFDWRDNVISSFIVFALEFCERAGYLSTGTYASKDGRFEIDFLDALKTGDGQLSATPARISKNTGVIEVNRPIFIKYTVAGRFAILCHEFSHFFVNNNMIDEIEADFHACQLYLGLGFPEIELLNVFGTVFLGADNEINRKRYDKIKEFIYNFNSNVESIKYR